VAVGMVRRAVVRAREWLRNISRLRERLTLPRNVEAGADRAERAVTRLLWNRRADRAGLAVLIVLYLLGFHTSSHTSDRITADEHRTNDALCVFRRDLESRAASAKTFLHEHPNGFAGFTASSIKVSLIGQERTIMALTTLKCPPR
jgi:hypothetical protein